MATPEENMQSALARAAKAKESGDLERAARWEASAERYKKMIAIKEKLVESKKTVETIKERIEKIKENVQSIKIEANTSGSSTGGNKVWIIPPGSGNGSTPSTPDTPSTISATPSSISPTTQTAQKPPVKTAPIDTVLINDDTLPIEIMRDLIFENLGGQELINIARNDTVNGQKIIYQPIANLFSIQQEYNSNNIVSIEGTANKYFQNFPINFDSKVPQKGTGPNLDHVYIDPQNGNLTVEAINIEGDEQIEIQIVIDGTIYEADL